MKSPELYKNRHQGERCVLVCNGPSLNKMDLRFLKNETVIGLNKIFLGFTKFNFYPRYYVAVNKKVIEQSASEIKGLTSVKFISDQASAFLKEDALTTLVNSKGFREEFSYDITKGIQEGYTVTYAALQIAFFLGFKKVIIIGMDHRFIYQGEPNEERILHGNDVNHFSQSYFRGQKWDNPDLRNSEKFYRIAKKVFEDNDRTIIDATVNGACEVFEKENYKEIFKEI